MYVNNIDENLKQQSSAVLKLKEGSIISGKLILNDDNSYSLKLFDGTLLPAVLVNSLNLDDTKFTRFMIKGFDGKNIILSSASDIDKLIVDENTRNILISEGIPEKIGNDIINSLIKFNLPVDNKNVFTLYKNIVSMQNLSTMKDDEILNLLQKNIKESINNDSIEFSIGKELFNELANVDFDTVSLFLENDIDLSFKNIIIFNELEKNKFCLNDIIDSLKGNTSLDNNDINKNVLLDLINTKLNTNSKMLNLKDVLTKIDFKSTTMESVLKQLNLLSDFSPIISHINNNYSAFSFNYYNDNQCYKNNIVIKKKYKSKTIDVSNVKIFINVNTPNLGYIESYISKFNNDIQINMKCEGKYIKKLKNSYKVLKNSLTQIGYNVSQITFDTLQEKNSVTSISNFFNDTKYKKLDVKV